MMFWFNALNSLSFRYFAKAGFLSVASFFLVACATQTITSAHHSFTAPQIAALTNWQLNGLFSFKDQSTGFSASLIWRDQNHWQNLQIIGPLGAWRAQLNSSPKGASLVASNGQEFHAKTLENLMEQNLHWYLPVEKLKFWVFGLPLPNVPAKFTRNAAGQISTIEQAGWQVQYQDYQVVRGMLLPSRIHLIHGSQKILLVIQHWQWV
jgi:outer membrane lipoprotein LolB